MTLTERDLVSGPLLLAIAAFALVAILQASVHVSGLGVAVEHRALLLSLVEHAGELGFGLAACFASVRTLGVLVSAAAALSLGALAATGQLSGYLGLPVSAFAGALNVCAWTLLLDEVRPLGRALRNSMFLLSCAVAVLVQLLAYGLLARRSVLGAPIAVQGLGVVVSVLLLLVCFTRGADEAPQSPSKPSRWGLVFALFALALPVKVAISAVALSRVGPLGTATSQLWLDNSVALLGQGSLLAVSVWLGVKRPVASAPRLAAWGILLGAALVPGFALGNGLALLASFGSGVVAAAAPLLVLVAALLTPRRLVPLMLAVWFSSGALVSRLADLARHWVAGDAAGQILLAIGASVLMIVSAVGLLLGVSAEVDGGARGV